MKLVNESLESYIQSNINEGLGEIYQKYAGKLKSLISKQLKSMAPEKLKSLRRDLQEFRGMNLVQIKNLISQKASGMNESEDNDGINIIDKLSLGAALASFVTLMINHWGLISLSGENIAKTGILLFVSIIIFLGKQALTNDDIG